MILFFSALTGFILGALPLNKFILNIVKKSNPDFSYKVSEVPLVFKIVIISVDFILGFLAANIPVFIFYGGFYATVISIAAMLAASNYLPWKKQYNLKSIATIEGALLLFNPVLFFAYLAMWLILLVYKRRIIFADIFTNTLVIILLITYSDIFNKNSYPSADKDFHLMIAFIVIFLIQLSSYYLDIKFLLLASKKSLRKSENESD